VSALVVTAPKHAVAELTRSEMAKNEATRGFDVEVLARKEIEVCGPIVRKRVAARMAFREKHHTGDSQHAALALFRHRRRGYGSER
jgi:hypothetical protein